MQFIYEIFKRGSISKAEAYVQLIKMNKKNFPDFIEKYLDKNFLPVYKSYIYHLDEQYKDKLDGTNNKTEGYFRATMPKGQKKKIPNSKRNNQPNLPQRQWFNKKPKRKEQKEQKT